MTPILKFISLSVALLLVVASCDDFVKTDPPRTSLIKSTVFESDATANAAMLDIYYQLRTGTFAGGTSTSISFLMSLSSDEQINYYLRGTPAINAEYQQIFDNALLSNNSIIFALWSDLYKVIYKSNAVLEGVGTSTQISNPVKKQLTGEAKFIRSFCFFYLVNLWGDIPLATSTNYRLNSEIHRSPVADVYAQIISDLTDAQNLLPGDYSAWGGERVRANKSVAAALLARVYLYKKDWSNAEAQATSVISLTSQYGLSATLAGVFLKNNREAILQSWSDMRVNERATFRVLSNPPLFAALRPQYVTTFEAGDQRRTNWIELTTGYYGPLKYTSTVDSPPTEYSTLLRVAEQYLIRAEARAQQENIAGAKSDINAIRTRAGLGNTTANDKAALLLAVEQERKAELFTEWGHRWFDLKRTNRADAVLGPLKTLWSGTDVLLPLPEAEIRNNAGLKDAQNPGY
ncbi:MAG: RagB/SusD family nutrient uptake outer membrane protein [Bacteroidota bacterium]